MAEAVTLSALLDQVADRYPARLALIEGERSFSFAELRGLVTAAAASLAARGISAGDRVAIWLPNRVEWLVLLFALARLGAVAVAVNTRFRSSELSYLLAKSKAIWLVLQPGFWRIDFRRVLAGVDGAALPDLSRVLVVDERDDDPILGHTPEQFSLADGPSGAADDRSAPDAPIVYFTTSGTTKGPKLVVHTQRSIALHAQDVARGFGLDMADARLLGMLPLCGTFGLASAIGALAGGAPVVIQSAFEAAEARDLLRRHNVTHSFGSDEMFGRILDLCPEERPFPSARMFGYAAFQPGGQAVAAQASARGVPLIGLYGSSEVQALFAAQPYDLAPDERVKGGGKPMAASAEVRVRDIESSAVLAPGEVGELEIKSPRSAFARYLDDPEETRKAIGADGFFRTGDLGSLRVDGTFIFETRRGDVMRLGGFLVSPVEIEDVLKTLPGVQDAQVVAVPIEGRTQPAAFVIARVGAILSAEQVIEAAGGCMAAYKVPRRVWFVDAFPVTESANGIKIQRTKLREMAQERLAAEAIF